MMWNDVLIVVPILPGKSEAWRRFWQVLEGSRKEAFSAWCEKLEIQVDAVWLVEPHQQETVVAIRLFFINPDIARNSLAHPETPFARWLEQQAFALHGIDLKTPERVDLHCETYRT